MAIKLRQEFGIDVFIDLLGYRRYGHNEADDPKFTQPLLYNAIAEHPTVLNIYIQQLIREGAISQRDAEKITRDFKNILQQSLRSARENKPKIEVNFLGRQWAGIRTATQQDFEESPGTGIPRNHLEKIGKALCSVPEKFTIYPKMKKLIGQRHNLVFNDKVVDWGLAELIAYGSLLIENTPVRLSGQDSRRGTFSHRHSVLIDANKEIPYIPLNHIQASQEKFYVYNSHLSEYGVLGFEYGYSLAMPQALTIWEAQFGDFANGAQIIIDQFISSSESKWQRMSGIVLFLPHGFEGQGPEHSSARLARFLELCAENNMIVVNPTTPANLFHLLRRQVKAPYRKPLIVMTPKSLLRHPLVKSKFSELTHGRFQEIIDDPQVKSTKNIKRLLLCTGKIYYDLLEKKVEENINDVAIVRFEQLYPISHNQDHQLLAKYQSAKEWVWVQEEPVNMGPWNFIRMRFAETRSDLQVISRPECASPASGSLKIHKHEQNQLVNNAFHNT